MSESYETVRVMWVKATKKWCAAGWPNHGPLWWEYSNLLARLRDAGSYEVAEQHARRATRKLERRNLR